MSQIRFTLQHNDISSTLKVGSLNSLLPQLSRQQWPSAWTSGERVNRVIFEYQLHTRTNQKFKVPAALTLSLSLTHTARIRPAAWLHREWHDNYGCSINCASIRQWFSLGAPICDIWHPQTSGLCDYFTNFIFCQFGYRAILAPSGCFILNAKNSLLSTKRFVVPIEVPIWYVHRLRVPSLCPKIRLTVCLVQYFFVRTSYMVSHLSFSLGDENDAKVVIFPTRRHITFCFKLETCSGFNIDLVLKLLWRLSDKKPRSKKC